MVGGWVGGWADESVGGWAGRPVGVVRDAWCVVRGDVRGAVCGVCHMARCRELCGAQCAVQYEMLCVVVVRGYGGHLPFVHIDHPVATLSIDDRAGKAVVLAGPHIPNPRADNVPAPLDALGTVLGQQVERVVVSEVVSVAWDRNGWDGMRWNGMGWGEAGG